MPPPSNNPSLVLTLKKGAYFVVQFKPGEVIPPALVERLVRNNESNKFISITRTPEEVSIIYDAQDDLQVPIKGNSPGWRCIKIAGPMDFGVTGVMCDFSTPLKAANIPIFALSTWNTDYILVPLDKGEQAVAVLKEDGWNFEG